MAGKTLKRLQRLFSLMIIHSTYTLVGAFLFLFLEECTSKKYQSKEYRDFEAYLVNMKVNETDRDRILNTTSKFLDAIDDRHGTCQVNRSTVLKWWNFTIITCATIGYGNITPKTNIGKILTMVYATLGIPIAMALYAASGDIIICMISYMLRKVEVDWLKRDQVKMMEKKKIVLSTLLLVVYIISMGFLLSSSEHGNITFIDSIYLVFQTLSTIGYGDLTDKLELNLVQTTYMILTALFGMGLTASLIASIVEAVKHLDVVKIIRKISFSSRSWSLNEESKKMEATPKNLAELTPTGVMTEEGIK